MRKVDKEEVRVAIDPLILDLVDSGDSRLGGSDVPRALCQSCRHVAVSQLSVRFVCVRRQARDVAWSDDHRVGFVEEGRKCELHALDECSI